MKLVSYILSGKTRLGALSGEYVVDVSRAHREMMAASPDPAARKIVDLLPAEILPFLERGQEGLWAARVALRFIEHQVHVGGSESYLRQGLLLPVSHVHLAAPVPRPPKLIAVWVNYEEHGAEAAIRAPKTAPLFFSKQCTSQLSGVASSTGVISP